MPSNITSNDSLWNSARELTTMKNRRSKSAPMKERLSNFSSDADDNSTAGGSSLDENTTEKNNTKAQEVPPSPGTDSPTNSNGSAKKGLFSKIRKVPLGGDSNTLDVFHFEGEGLQFKGKLIGIKDVDGARGDEMCLAAMTELKNNLKQTKEHKTKIGVGIALSGLKIKDEKGTTVMHQHPIPKISYVWRDPKEHRTFGYIYGTPDSGHRFFAVKADKSADSLVAAIHRLFQVAFRMKQHEIEMAKKGQDGEGSSVDGKMEGSADADKTMTKVDEANLLDLETELEVLSHAFSQGIEQTSVANGQGAWADFGNDSSSTSSSSDPFGGRGSTPHSIRTITPDPFDTVGSNGAFQVPNQHPHLLHSLSQPAFSANHVPVHSVQAWAAQSSAINIGHSSQPAVDPFMVHSHSTSVLSHQASAPAGFGYFDQNGGNVFNNGGGVFGTPMGNGILNTPHNTPINPMEIPDAAFVSVFDKPVAQPVAQAPLLPGPPQKKNSVVSNEGEELFKDLQTIGAPRAEKTSKKSFPMPVPPKLGDLRGDVPSTVIPSPSTIDPFLVTMAGSPGSPSFPMNGFGGVSPPQVPPRPSPPQSSAMPTIAPPPAPRRNGVAAAPSVFGSQNENPFMTNQLNQSAAFGSPFAASQPNMFASPVNVPVFQQTNQLPFGNQRLIPSAAMNDPFADQFFK